MTSSQASVSVVIPLYNRAACIQRAIDSVLAQTFDAFELIVVDDGSSDGGGDLVRAYRDPRVRVVTQPNRGECGARNAGVLEARTPWLAFLDSDDEWLPGFLTHSMAAVTANPDIVGAFTNFYRDGGQLHIAEGTQGGAIDDYFDFFVKHRGHGISSSSVVVRKESLLAAGGFPLGVRHGGDVDTWTRLAWIGRVAYVPKALAVFHTEAVDRVSREDAAAVTKGPLPTIASYDRWKANGRIPKHLSVSSARMVQYMYLQYAHGLVNANNATGARSILHSKCRPLLCGIARYSREYLRTLLPRWCLS
jgi:glycosyltransferase involved in cell wall biosynthesis